MLSPQSEFWGGLSMYGCRQNIKMRGQRALQRDRSFQGWSVKISGRSSPDLCHLMFFRDHLALIEAMSIRFSVDSREQKLLDLIRAAAADSFF